MSVARDFEDDEREFGGAAIVAALDNASYPWAEGPPIDDGRDEPRVSFEPTPYVWRDPATIPRRQYLYGFELKRGMLSAVIAPGAAGKTTYKVGRAIAMATGRDLFGHRVWNGPHRVWLWNLEDEREEIEKCVAAYLKYLNIDPTELGDRLLLDGADAATSTTLKIAVEDSFGGFKLQRPVTDALIETIRAHDIAYLDIDPFVSSHGIDENSNQAIDAVSKEWARVAREANCAINLTHHVRKGNGGEMTAMDARGAGAMVNAARSVLVLQGMSKDHAANLQVPECERKRYFSVYDDKNNKAAASLHAEWYSFVGVGLGNGDDTGPEDNVGACERWTPPDMFAGITPRHLLFVQKLIDANPEQCRKHSTATQWVGKLIGEAIDKDYQDRDDKKAIVRMVDTWVQEGALKVTTRPDRKSMPVEYIEVGRWVEP